MGLLKVGKPLSWDEAAGFRNYVRRHGVLQFLHTLSRVKDISNDTLLWGDEIEYAILQVRCAWKFGDDRSITAV